nr:PREDICTED: renin receptor [Bemisia tabaci]
MKGALLWLFSVFISVFGAGEVLFLHSPDSIEFRGHEQFKLSLLSDVLARIQGFSVRQTSDWSGMSVITPFKFAEAAVCVVLPGISGIDSDQGHRFSLETDEPLDETWHKMFMNVELRFAGQNQTFSKVTLGDEDEFQVEESEKLFADLTPAKSVDYKLKYLNPDVEVDQAFLNQVKYLKAIPNTVTEKISPNGVPDIFWIVVPGLHPLADKYGSESKPVHEAKRLLADVLVQITDVFEEIYSGKVAVATVMSDAAHTRRYRRDAPNALTDFDLGEDDYSDDFPAIFNIFLWLSLAFIFSLIAVAISIIEMDPGRDSIIYRMTSNRMKKDN